MPSLFDTFRFTANDGTGDHSVTPANRGLVRQWEREGDTRAYRLKLVTKLLFRGEDYTYFRDLYDAGDCEEVTLLIENKCGGEWATWHEGIVPVFTGDYNASRCEVAFEIKPNDVYECAKQGFDKRENWLDYAEPTTVKTLYGTVETISCIEIGSNVASPSNTVKFFKKCWSTGTTTSPDPDPALAWRPIKHHQNTTFNTPTGFWRISGNTLWAREKATSVSSPPGGGWINISGTTWVRPITISFVVKSYSQDYGVDWEATTINQSRVSNGRVLSDVLTAAVDALDCNIDEVVSNFFNINPDATNPSNDAYDFAADNFSHLFFFQKSDIVRASASNDATRFTFSLREFFEEMKLLNVFHAIETDAGTVRLRIEHYTYFDGANGTDLTTLDGGRYIAGKDSFQVESEVPNFESFAYQESFRDKFRTKRITYPAACATVQGDERTARQLCTDFGGLVENPDAGLEGFFLLATYDIGGGEYLMNTLGGEANGAFAWENVLPALWADGRFHMGATANVAGYAVNSIKKTLQQSQITIKFCCGDTFEASELINTQLGWGEVKSAVQDTERGTLKIDLLQ